MGDIRIKKLTDRIWYLPASHETDRPVLAAIQGDKYTLMMDAGNSPKHSQLFLQELKRVGVPHPHFLILTHWHWDHIFGLSSLNIPSFAHHRTNGYMEKLKTYEWTDIALTERVNAGVETSFCAEMIKKEYGSERENIQIVLPTFTYDERIRIDLGNITCLVEHVGGDHADDSSILYIEQEKVLFIGDSISPHIYGPNRYYRLEVISSLLDQLESYNADMVIHSHSTPWKKADFSREMSEYRDVITAVKKYGNDLPQISKDLSVKWNRENPDDDISFFQYFINGLDL